MKLLIIEDTDREIALMIVPSSYDADRADHGLTVGHITGVIDVPDMLFKNCDAAAFLYSLFRSV